jgi:S-adenosylmethionine-diacylglycerol 3-amino-3-carboxypropyl transferase
MSKAALGSGRSALGLMVGQTASLTASIPSRAPSAERPEPRRQPLPPLPAAFWAAGELGKRRKGPPEILFAQVREDAAVEVAALAACERPEAAFCIGSGGCTAFSLLTGGLARLDVVDINPAQVYLLELKKAAFEQLSYPEMLRAMTADARSDYPALRPHLTPAASAFWDARQPLLSGGLNQCGIVERKLLRVTRFFLPLQVGRRRVEEMFRQTDLDAQRAFYRAYWDTWRWKSAFRLGLSRPGLRLVYGKPFVERAPVEFWRLMKRQVDATFLDFPIGENSYLWQTFLGRYPPGEEGLPIYLRRKYHAEVQAGMARVVLTCSDAAGFLEAQAPASIGFYALSNILEITTPEYTARLVAAILKTAKPGAVVCVRSIFPPGPDDLGCGPGPLRLDVALTERLARSDRSFFCRFLRVLRVDR